MPYDGPTIPPPLMRLAQEARVAGDLERTHDLERMHKAVGSWSARRLKNLKIGAELQARLKLQVIGNEEIRRLLGELVNDKKDRWRQNIVSLCVCLAVVAIPIGLTVLVVRLIR